MSVDIAPAQATDHIHTTLIPTEFVLTERKMLELLPDQQPHLHLLDLPAQNMSLVQIIISVQPQQLRAQRQLNLLVS